MVFRFYGAYFRKMQEVEPQNRIKISSSEHKFQLIPPNFFPKITADASEFSELLRVPVQVSLEVVPIAQRTMHSIQSIRYLEIQSSLISDSLSPPLSSVGAWGGRGPARREDKLLDRNCIDK